MNAKDLRRRQRNNQAVARCIPLLLICAVAYGSYVFVGPLCVDYLLNTPPDARVPQRIGLGIALPIVYFCLLLPMAISYFRLLYVVTFNPGLTERRHPPPEPLQKAPDYPEQTKTTRSCVRTTIADHQEPIDVDREGVLKGRVPAPPGIEEYYTKDVFQCDSNGLPLWCQACSNWKPDRSHHCSDIGRCCLKMDHFCPWVGGVVGENGHKFFVQFTTYATIFTAYSLVVLAIFVAESKQTRGTIGSVHWVVAMGLCGFFCLFTFGLALMSTHLAFRNVTTIENIDVATSSIYLAVLLPPEMQHEQNLQFPPPVASSRHRTPPSRSGDSSAPLTSEIDDPAHASYFSNNGRTISLERSARPRKRSRDDPAAQYWHGTITYPLYLPPDRPPLPLPESRTFAILRTPPGMNPWNLGAYHNFTSVFGTRPHHWLLPVSHSPCTKHDSNVSFYAMGWEFEQLLQDARLVQPPDFIKKARRRGSSLGGQTAKKRKRRLDEGWQNGERPPGWEMEKEARRLKRMQREREGWDGERSRRG